MTLLVQVEEALQDEDQDDFYILSKIADILHSLFGSHGPDLFPLFDCLLPHYAKLLVRRLSLLTVREACGFEITMGCQEFQN